MFRTAFFVFMLMFSFVQPNESHVLPDDKVYDIPEMIEYFTLDAAGVATIQSWDIGSGENSPVKWTDTQPQWDAASSTYTKTGIALISVNGVPTSFNVILSGTKIVVNRVQLNLSKSPSVQVFDLEKILHAGGIATTFIKCDNPMPKSYGTLIWAASIPKKKEAWVAYIWQCLKGECSANINIYYEKEKTEKLLCY